MKEHWQRRPLLVRRAFEAFEDPLSPAEVLDVATSDRVPSRLVWRSGRKWMLEHGPFAPSRFKQLPRREWTVLVQDTNHVSTRADELLAAFDFIPHARIDDVMVSYAVPGGGVGPHVDSYDVFLLQGCGRRRWRISRQRDLELVDGLPLKILERFEPEHEWVLEAGDMLYLPPGVAHDGVAESECLTWSIGFRAPSDEELAQGFLDHVRDRIRLEGQYGDRGAKPAREPGALPNAMVEHAEDVLAKIRWSTRDAADFMGRFLSEPKTHVFFEPPHRPLARARFAAVVAARGLALDARSRLLFDRTRFFINGEAIAVPVAARPHLRKLANRRRLDAPLAVPPDFLELAYAWYLQGFLVPGKERP